MRWGREKKWENDNANDEGNARRNGCVHSQEQRTTVERKRKREREWLDVGTSAWASKGRRGEGAVERGAQALREQRFGATRRHQSLLSNRETRPGVLEDEYRERGRTHLSFSLSLSPCSSLFLCLVVVFFFSFFFINPQYQSRVSLIVRAWRWWKKEEKKKSKNAASARPSNPSWSWTPEVVVSPRSYNTMLVQRSFNYGFKPRRSKGSGQGRVDDLVFFVRRWDLI